MKNDLVLKNRLKMARAEKGLSQSDLAEMIGVSRNTVSSIETGQFNPTAKLALILCIALDKKFEELFFFEEQFDEKLQIQPSQSTASEWATPTVDSPVCPCWWVIKGRQQKVLPPGFCFCPALLR